MALTLLDAGNELRVMDGPERVFGVVSCRNFDGRDARGVARWATAPRADWTIRLASPSVSVACLDEIMALLPK